MIILLGLAVLLLATCHGKSSPLTLIGSLVTVNNTTAYSSTNAIQTPQVSLQVFQFSNGGLTATNAAVLYVQISPDTTNWFNVGNPYYFAQTNQGTYPYYPPATNFTVYLRVQATTTNSVGLGGTYGN